MQVLFVNPARSGQGTVPLNIPILTSILRRAGHGVRLFDFSEIEDYVRALTGDREYQFQAVKRILIYLWGGVYANVTELARENYRADAVRELEKFLRLSPKAPEKARVDSVLAKLKQP